MHGRGGSGSVRLPLLLLGGGVIAALAAFAWLGWTRGSGSGEPRPPLAAPALPAAAQEPPVERLKAKVTTSHPHDSAAYTQGLLLDGDQLFESTGLYGSSSLRRVDRRSGKVLRRVEVAGAYFAEGLAKVGERLIQLTWREGKAFVYDAATFERRAEIDYVGEGWGLCYDGRRLVMSDGSAQLTFRDPATLAVLGQVQVALDGQPVPQLNELECVDGAVYANVYTTDEIVRIDPGSGRVTAVIDAAGLLTGAEREKAEVLNGIAYDPAKKVFLITGKLWPRLFEVEFVPP